MSSLAWTELLNAGNSVHPPGNYLEAAFVYDPVHDLNIGYGINSLLFYFDPTTNTWTDHSSRQTGDIPLPSPSGGLGKLIYNTADQHVYFFGGQTTLNAEGLQNDLYQFEPTTFRWTRLNPVGGVKPPKDGSVLYPWMVYDSKRNRLIHYIDTGNIWQDLVCRQYLEPARYSGGAQRSPTRPTVERSMWLVWLDTIRSTTPW